MFQKNLNYKFLYRAWEKLHGGRYGEKNSDELHRFHHREERIDGTTKGQYRFELPNGKIQVVSYKQMGEEYLAKVNYLGRDQAKDSCLGLGKDCARNEEEIEIENFDVDYDYVENEGKFGTPVHASELLRPLKSANPHNVPKPISADTIYSKPTPIPYQPPTTQSYIPITTKPPQSLYKNVDIDKGVMYGINNQVAIAYNYGGPSTGTGVEIGGLVYESSKQPENYEHKNKPYFDPVANVVPLKPVKPISTTQSHPEYYIPSSNQEGRGNKHYRFHSDTPQRTPVHNRLNSADISQSSYAVTTYPTSVSEYPPSIQLPAKKPAFDDGVQGYHKASISSYGTVPSQPKQHSQFKNIPPLPQNPLLPTYGNQGITSNAQDSVQSLHLDLCPPSQSHKLPDCNSKLPSFSYDKQDTPHLPPTPQNNPSRKPSRGQSPIIHNGFSEASNSNFNNLPLNSNHQSVPHTQNTRQYSTNPVLQNFVPPNNNHQHQTLRTSQFLQNSAVESITAYGPPHSKFSESFTAPGKVHVDQKSVSYFRQQASDSPQPTSYREPNYIRPPSIHEDVPEIILPTYGEAAVASILSLPSYGPPRKIATTSANSKFRNHLEGSRFSKREKSLPVDHHRPVTDTATTFRPSYMPIFVKRPDASLDPPYRDLPSMLTVSDDKYRSSMLAGMLENYYFENYGRPNIYGASLPASIMRNMLDTLLLYESALQGHLTPPNFESFNTNFPTAKSYSNIHQDFIRPVTSSLTHGNPAFPISSKGNFMNNLLGKPPKNIPLAVHPSSSASTSKNRNILPPSITSPRISAYPNFQKHTAKKKSINIADTLELLRESEQLFRNGNFGFTPIVIKQNSKTGKENGTAYQETLPFENYSSSSWIPSKRQNLNQDNEFEKFKFGPQLAPSPFRSLSESGDSMKPSTSSFKAIEPLFRDSFDIPREPDESQSTLVLAYDPHATKDPPQYPPVGDPNYRTSIIRFPDSDIKPLPNPPLDIERISYSSVENDFVWYHDSQLQRRDDSFEEFSRLFHSSGEEDRIPFHPLIQSLINEERMSEEIK